MTEISSWDDSPAGALVAALGGQRPGDDRPGKRRTEAEQAELRRQWEAQMDAADKAGAGYAGELGAPTMNPWRERQRQIAEFAQEVRQRGNWLGSPHCTQCEQEQSGQVSHRIHPGDHECHRQHLEIQQALASRVLWQRAEHDGSIRRGVTNPVPDAAAVQMRRESLASRIAAQVAPRGPSEVW